MQQLTLGVLARSRKEHEHRLPIHPRHLGRIDADIRANLYLEHGYGERFGVPDAHLESLVAGMRSREQLIAGHDVVLLAKPVARDLAGQVLGGAGRTACRTRNSPSRPSTGG
ncbi:hypothetical protein [Amycolatopsis sp. NPDC054798]